MSRAGGEEAYEIFIDGSSRGNPGHAGCGVVIRDAQGNVLLEEGYSLGEMTNNSAEYNALIIALEQALVLKAESVRVHADSELLVRQMNGRYRVKHEDLKLLHGRARQLASRLKTFSIEHVRREGNRDADRLAQQASGESAKSARSHGQSPTKPSDRQDKLF